MKMFFLKVKTKGKKETKNEMNLFIHFLNYSFDQLCTQVQNKTSTKDMYFLT